MAPMKWHLVYLMVLSLSGPLWAQDAPESGAPPASGIDLPSGLGDTCKKRAEDAEKLHQIYKVHSGTPDDEKAPSSCFQAVQESYEKCARVPSKVSAPSSDGKASVKNSAQSMLEDSNSGQEQNSAKASECKEQKKQAESKCKEAMDGLKKALRNNGKEWEDLTSKYEALPGSDPSRADIKAQADERQRLNLKLQAQMHAGQYLSDASSAALDNYSQCWSDEARRNELIAEYSANQLAKASSDDPPANDLGQANQPLTNCTDPSCEKAKSNDGDQISNAVTSTAKSEALFAAGGVVKQNVVSAFGSGAGVAAGAASDALSSATPSMLARAGTAVGAVASSLPLGAAGMLMSMTGPAGACSEYYTSYMAANAAGCSAAANNAVSNLGGN